jgi:hypothetical protein
MPVLAPAAFLLALLQAPAPASPPAAPPSPGAACTGADHRAFDFWIGEWEVTNQRPRPGQHPPPSQSRISRILSGCAVLEEYETPSGYAGKSLNFYDAGAKAWRQVWIDTGGEPLFLRGGRQGAAMVLADEGGAGKAMNRITWTPLDGGRVRQHWEVSKDGGKTFETAFDGLYSPRAPRK